MCGTGQDAHSLIERFALYEHEIIDSVAVDVFGWPAGVLEHFGVSCLS